MAKYKWAVISRERGTENKWEIAEHTIVFADKMVHPLAIACSREEHTIAFADKMVHPLAIACSREEARIMKAELDYWEDELIEFKVVKLANDIDAKSFVMQYGCYTA